MSRHADRSNGLDFIYEASRFKRRAEHRDRNRPRSHGVCAMSRRRTSSVPVGAMIAALAVIAAVAFLVLYIGGSIDVTGFVDPPVVE